MFLFIFSPLSLALVGKAAPQLRVLSNEAFKQNRANGGGACTRIQQTKTHMCNIHVRIRVSS